MTSKTNGAVPWVLLTNDDGVDSPALVPLLRELSGIIQVRAVVPAQECSWTAKILSRFAPLQVEPRKCGGFPVWAVNGYPADCANLGIHTLFETPPTLVISGVNLGSNAGLAFFLSSGTVGAAIEGMLGGVSAAAFSVQLNAADYACWRQQRKLAPGMAELLNNAAVVTGEIVRELLLGGLPGGSSLLNVNLPPTTTPQTPRRLAGVTLTDYGAYFTPDGPGRFIHRFSGLQVRKANQSGDIAVLERGEVAIAPLRFVLDMQPTAADRRRFEKGDEA